MATTKDTGDKGEAQAEEYLSALGYRIVERNWRTRFGEIDIIASEGETLVFVEVKAKSSDLYGTPAEMITRKKIAKVTRAAESYMIDRGYKGTYRIDAIVILASKLEHIKCITL